MSKLTKKIATCKGCGSGEALYATLSNGERIPSYVWKIADGIYCYPCANQPVPVQECDHCGEASSKEMCDCCASAEDSGVLADYVDCKVPCPDCAKACR